MFQNYKITKLLMKVQDWLYHPTKETKHSKDKKTFIIDTIR